MFNDKTIWLHHVYLLKSSVSLLLDDIYVIYWRTLLNIAASTGLPITTNGLPMYTLTREQVPGVHLFAIAIHCFGQVRVCCDTITAKRQKIRVTFGIFSSVTIYC